ncbi:MAG: cob(I)yrinic acid a,c-diamide adenosyltransferase [Patescibacteria group bacterium]
MKIYTKTGDKGETALLGGKRVKKSCLEIDAIGEVDELNAGIGLLVSFLEDTALVKDKLEIVQHRLFTIGANIADVQMQLGSVPKLEIYHVQVLEEWIDEMEKDLQPLTQFILPGGHRVSAQAFFARAICRRAERRVVELRETYPGLDPLIQQYLNRLSDTLFVLGRWYNANRNVPDVAWQKNL